MPKFQKSVRLDYTPVQVYDLISDIKSYPKFIRWIKALRVTNERVDGSKTSGLGEVVVGFKGFTEKFSTNVTSNSEDFSVRADLVKGPFSRLHAIWQVTPLATGLTEINLSIDYQFNNFLIGMVARANHDLAVGKVLGAFMAEAERRYGKPVAAVQPSVEKPFVYRPFA